MVLLKHMKRVAWNKGITKYEPKQCLCGCGEFVKLHKYKKKGSGGFSYVVNDFIKEHALRGKGGFNPNIHIARLCSCGCGLTTNKHRGHFNLFIKGHENRGRISWNKGKLFSREVKNKMSLAHLGKEPVNKAFVEPAILYKHYVKDNKSISAVSNELGISKDVIKNRLREFGWNRSTKETCTTQAFRELMRSIRIKVLSSQKAIENPNKLEKLVYKEIESFKIPFKKQAPLFNKFVVDAFFPQRALVLEIFGRYWHEMDKIKQKDYSKKRYLEKCGYKVEEIWDYQIKKENLHFFLEQIFKKHQLI